MLALSIPLSKIRLTGLLCYTQGRHGWWLVLLAWLGLLGLPAHAQRPTLRLDLLPEGLGFDRTYVYFEQGATTGFDASFDAIKLPNSSGLNLASFESGGQQLAINGLPLTALDAPFTVNLFVGVPTYGTYTVQISQFDNLASSNVYLTDALLNTSTQLVLGATYSFDLTAANTAGTYATSTRFALQFMPGTAPLPVTLIGFTAVAQAAGVRVSWSTASELHSAYFAVERSRDGQAFGEIGRLPAASTSSQAHGYELLDAQPLAEIAYYRLRQVDLDGRFYYSPVRVVNGRASTQLSIIPNPAHAAATLLGAVSGASIQVIDALGRVVATATADAIGVSALPAGLPSGLYMVHTGLQMTRLVVE